MLVLCAGSIALEEAVVILRHDGLRSWIGGVPLSDTNIGGFPFNLPDILIQTRMD